MKACSISNFPFPLYACPSCDIPSFPLHYQDTWQALPWYTITERHHSLQTSLHVFSAVSVAHKSTQWILAQAQGCLWVTGAGEGRKDRGGNALPFLKLMKHKIHKLIQFHSVPRHKALYAIHAAAPADGPTSMEKETPARPTTSLLLWESKDNCLKHCWPHMLKQNITVNP